MYKKQKFENFLESLKGNGQDILIESVKKGFQVCVEGMFDDDYNPIEELNKLSIYSKPDPTSPTSEGLKNYNDIVNGVIKELYHMDEDRIKKYIENNLDHPYDRKAEEVEPLITILSDRLLS